MKVTIDEIMVYCMAQQIKDGEVVVQGLATPMVAIAYLLARQTHAPNIYFASAIGQGLCRYPAPISLTRVEGLWLDRALASVGFVTVAADLLPTMKPKEFFRPAQVDPFGNFNNIAFGKNYNRPRMRLPGTGGIPDVTTYSSQVYLYVPRHSRLTFVEELDFISGLGHNAKRTHGKGPRYLISDLGQFDFDPSSVINNDKKPRLRLTTYHPGIDIERIRVKTGFELIISAGVKETPIPDKDELKLLRDVIDPLRIRCLELLSGTERRNLLHRILDKERIV
jgi:acyl CoA:acetate/3-ketoacid CoA transferase beta subunit